jgi:hypothetical protein
MNTALRCTTSAAAGSGLGTTIKFLKRTTSGTAGNDRVQRAHTSTRRTGFCAIWVFISSSSSSAPRATAGRNDQAPAMHTSGAADNGLGTTIMYLRAATGIGLGTTVKYLQRSTSDAKGFGLGTTIKYLRRTTSAAANSGVDTAIKYLENQDAGAGSNWAKAYTKAGHEFR